MKMRAVMKFYPTQNEWDNGTYPTQNECVIPLKVSGMNDTHFEWDK
jgi:hypothetical protein